jgi:hypothetical protein
MELDAVDDVVRFVICLYAMACSALLHSPLLWLAARAVRRSTIMCPVPCYYQLTEHTGGCCVVIVAGVCRWGR